MNHCVELENVTKRFGKKTAVDRLDLAVPEGAVYGFIGPNGSGKTTTLRLILRIFQPDAGRVAVLGADRGSVADDRLGYLPEERGLYRRMKVAELITYFARLKGYYDCRADVDRWLERLDATSWAKQRVDSLSKGMAQKVQFIVAVIARPQLVILDEPFAGLDPVNLDVLKEAVLSLRDEGVTVIFSTHDMNVAEQMCDSVFMIFQGRKVLDGSLDQIRREHAAGRVRLRIADDAGLPEDLPGVVTATRDNGSFLLDLDDRAPPHSLLRQIAAVREVDHFEVVRPTLHDIFVQIAKPDPSIAEAS